MLLELLCKQKILSRYIEQDRKSKKEIIKKIKDKLERLKRIADKSQKEMKEQFLQRTREQELSKGTKLTNQKNEKERQMK